MEKTISWAVADAMMSMAAYITTLQYYHSVGKEPDVDYVNNCAREWFESFCECNGIEGVEEAV